MSVHVGVQRFHVCRIVPYHIIIYYHIDIISFLLSYHVSMLFLSFLLSSQGLGGLQHFADRFVLGLWCLLSLGILGILLPRFFFCQGAEVTEVRFAKVERTSIVWAVGSSNLRIKPDRVSSALVEHIFSGLEKTITFGPWTARRTLSCEL